MCVGVCMPLFPYHPPASSAFGVEGVREESEREDLSKQGYRTIQLEGLENAKALPPSLPPLLQTHLR